MTGQNQDINNDHLKELQQKDSTESLENAVKELSKELGQSDAMYKDVLDGMLHVVNIIDEDLTIIWANKTALEKWGDIIGKKCYKVYKGRDTVCPDCTVRHVFKDGKNFQSERSSIYPDGTRGEFIVTSSPLKDSQGNTIAAIEMLTDISERKQLERRIKESEERIKAILTGIGDRITIYDKNLDIIWVNQSVRNVWGDTRGKKCYKVYKGLAEKCPDCYVETVFNEGETVVSERGLIRPDGRRSYLLITSSPIRDAQGRIISVVDVVKDITERKHLERKIEESEAKQQANLTAIGDLITIQNKDLDIIWVNQQIRDLWGDVVGKKCYEEYKGLTTPCPECTVETVLKDEKTLVSERPSILPDGSTIDILTTSSPVRDAEGNIVAVVEVIKNVTERKQLEKQLKDHTENLEKVVEERTKALRESEAKQQAILTAIGDRITIQNKELDIIWANQTMKDVYGADIIGKKCYKVYKELTEKCPDCTVKKVFNDEETVASEGVVIHPDGGLTNILTTSSPVRDAEGNVVAVIEVVKDITKRKQLEKQLVESEERYRGLYDSSIDGIASVDMEGRIVECNQAYANMLGYTKEELFKLTTYDLILPKWRDMLNEVVAKQIVPRSYSDELEIEYIKRDGTIFPVSVRIWLIKDEEGTPIGRWGITRDITERKKLDQMKSQFINVAAHELRTPLSALKAHADLLKIKSERGFWDLPEDVHKKINIITRNADRLAVLINNLLDYTRLEAGTVKLKLELCSIDTIVSQVIQEVLPLAKKHEHALDLHSPEILSPISIDKELIHRIFSNLLSNSVKYTPDGGSINVTILNEKDNLHATVKDTGIGIAEKDLEEIFLPFYVADIPDNILYKSEFERTGLGLAITKEYVKMHGGTIWVESRIGEGSTFHVLLPKKKMES